MTLPPLPGDSQPNQPSPEPGGWPDSPPPEAGGWPDARQPAAPDWNGPTAPGTGDWQQPPQVGAEGWQQQPPPPQAPGWQPGPPIPAPGGGKSYVWLFVVFGAVMVLLIGAAVWVGVTMFDGDDDGKDSAGGGEPKAEVTDGGISLGGGDTRVDIYVDFGCPACASFHTDNGETLSKAVEEKKATVVFHAMTFLDQQFTDEYSSRAANASVCAADGDKYLEYFDTLMTEQPAEGGDGLSDTRLVELGGKHGLGADFGDCVTGGDYRDWVKKHASADGISATPTIRIDGKDVTAADFATQFAAATG